MRLERLSETAWLFGAAVLLAACCLTALSTMSVLVRDIGGEWATKSESVKTLRSRPSTNSEPPVVVNSAHPIWRAERAKLSNVVREEIGIELARLGVAITEVRVSQNRDFGRGLRCLSVSVEGRADTLALGRTMKWLMANKDGLVLEHVSVRPVGDTEQGNLHLKLSLLVLAALEPEK